MKLAFLGLGKMGTAISKLLLNNGEDLTVWNRTPARAEALAGDGARVARTAAEAVAAADIVFTMVMDDAAMVDVLHNERVLESMPKGAIHVSLSTLSVPLSRRLTDEHAARGQHFVAAPVFGRPHVAEQGRLWIVAGGSSEAIDKVRPLLEKFSRGLTVVSPHPWSAHAMKLGGNFLITAMIASLTEGMIYAEALEIDPAVYADTINKALFQSPFYEMYSNIMLHPPAIPGGTIALGEKDTRLFREAAQGEQVHTPLADLFASHLDHAIEAGMKDQDWAAGYYQLARGLESGTKP